MEELPESELGEQSYWDDRYKEEFENFANHGDPGEIWFGKDAMRKVINWIKKTESIQQTSKILDLGCGNGMFLIELSNNGYRNLHGLDYSEDAIKLAQFIAIKHNFTNIKYSTCNILENLEGTYDVIHDKGTYDAISLNKNAKEYRMRYLENVEKSLNDQGFFIITSCNWTRNELDLHFCKHFSCVDVLPTKQFQFGGKTGNVVTSVAYKKIQK